VPAPHFDPFGSRGVTRRGLLVLGALTAVGAAAGCSGSSTPSKAKSTAPTGPLELNFDSGSLGAPITTHIGAKTSRAYAHSGAYGCRLEPTVATKGIASLVVDQHGFPQNKHYASFSMYFRLVTPPKKTDAYMNLFEIATTSTAGFKSQFTVFFRNDRLYCDFAYHEVLEIGPMPSVGHWHRLEALVDYSGTTYIAEVRVDGGAAKTLKSKNDKKPESVRALYVHYPSVPVDYTVDIDDITMDTTDSAPKFDS
jgi:hypothetical protein